MGYMQEIIIVEDQPDILELVSLHLNRSGFKAISFTNAADFFKYIEKTIPSLIILDLMLPDMDGLEICKTLKKSSKYENIPIIMLTAKAEEPDKIIGLELGADDYIAKPFSPRELIARVKTVLRRTTPDKKQEKMSSITVKDLIIDLEKCCVHYKENKITLTSTEFKILQLLASKPGKIFSRDQILDFIWGKEKIVVDRTIDVHIRHLREKLGKAADFIKNSRGFGYKFDED